MTVLTNDNEIDITAGDYVFNVLITSGTVSFQLNTDDIGFNTIDGSPYSADVNGVMALSNCKFKALITGTASVSITRQKLNV